jgi:hypothetical protein
MSRVQPQKKTAPNNYGLSSRKDGKLESMSVASNVSSKRHGESPMKIGFGGLKSSGS